MAHSWAFQVSSAPGALAALTLIKRLLIAWAQARENPQRDHLIRDVMHQSSKDRVALALGNRRQIADDVGIELGAHVACALFPPKRFSGSAASEVRNRWGSKGYRTRSKKPGNVARYSRSVACWRRNDDCIHVDPARFHMSAPA